MKRTELLDAAARIVTRDRNSTHGAPEESFGRIAAMWSGYLGVTLDPADVAAMMILLKVARIGHNPINADNWIDIAGYAACGAELMGVDSEAQP